MYLQRENNPHFIEAPLSPQQSRRPRPPRPPTQGPQLQLAPQLPDLPLPPAYKSPHSSPGSPPRVQPKRRPYDQPPGLPVRTGFKQYPSEDTQSVQSQLHPEEPHFGQRGQPQQGNRTSHTRTGQPPVAQLQGQQGQPQQRASDFRVPTSRKTKPIAWLIAACCTLFWIIVIAGGLAVLIIYLVFRPHLPKFDVSNASLNAAYLDMDYLLNADLTLLANFTNPNRKVNVEFNYAIINLYHEQNFIATRYVEPFMAIRGQSKFEEVHMIASQVPLTFRHSQDLKRQMESGRVMFDIKGFFRAKSRLGFLSYSYWLYSHCTITLTGPPAGIMIGKKCTTNR